MGHGFWVPLHTLCTQYDPCLGYPGLYPTFYERTGGVLKLACLQGCSETAYYFPAEDLYNTARLVMFLRSEQSFIRLCSQVGKCQG